MFMSSYSVLARWASSGSWPWVLGGDAASCCSAHWLISACGFGQHWQQALDTLKVIRQTAVLPIVTSYSAVAAVINACEGGQHWHQALGLLAAMQQLLFWPMSFTTTPPYIYICIFTQCLRGGPAVAAGLGCVAAMQQADVLPNGLSVLVGRSSKGSRLRVFWR